MGPRRRDGLRECTPGGFCYRRRRYYPVALGRMCVLGGGGENWRGDGTLLEEGVGDWGPRSQHIAVVYIMMALCNSL